MIRSLFLCTEDSEHHDIDAIKSHDNSGNNKEETNLKYKWVQGMSLVLKSLEENNRRQKHKEYSIYQVSYAFN